MIIFQSLVVFIITKMKNCIQQGPDPVLGSEIDGAFVSGVKIPDSDRRAEGTVMVDRHRMQEP